MKGRGALRLGVATSLTGRYAPFGLQVAEGLRCYVRDVSSGAGIRPELLLEDDRGDPRTLRERLRKLVREDRVDLLFGPYGSGLTLVAAETASALGVILWNHGGASDEIHERFPRWCVGVLSPASTYLATVLEMVDTVAPPLRRVALVHAETGFGAEIARGVLEWAARRRCTVFRRSYRSGDSTAVETAAAELLAEPVDVVLGAGRFEDDLALAEALWRLRPKTRAVALVAAGIDRFREALDERAEGFLAPS
ncbi:MAG: ABC transporter substrate-binding protein, partial [Candidatus Binatia bacterium]